jgi:hypothetical protein
MDHHCPWVNNCVAIFNQKYFLLFLFYTGGCTIYSAALLLARFMSCTRNLGACSITGAHQVGSRGVLLRNFQRGCFVLCRCVVCSVLYCYVFFNVVALYCVGV